MASEKSPAEIAAASADPYVRDLALRRLAIDDEIKGMDAFLSYYASKASEMKPTPPVEAKAKAPPKSNGSTSPKGKTERVIDAAIAVTTAAGRPLSLQEVRDEIARKYPELAPVPEVSSLRARLNEHKARIVRIDDKGYWPADVPVPALDG